jgi:2-methylcitrate dehydratase PrpD
MTVRLADGRVLAERVAAARGTAANPLSAEEFEEKFRRLAGAVLTPERVERLTLDLRRLASLPDVAPLVALAGR